MKTAKQFLGLIIFLGLSLSAISQEVIVPTKENTHEADSGKVFDSSEINPSFPGGMQAQMTFLANNIVYPEIAKEQGIQGTVFVNFIAEKDGRLTHIKILRGVSTEIDQEVIRVVKKMPRWEAGTNKGEKVRVRLNMPVKFLLQADVEPSEETIKEDEIFILVEDNASFPGGDDTLRKYLKDHIQYPEMAKKNGIEGRVYLKFVVEKDGSITNIKVLRGIGSGCDEEAVRVVSNMPKWNPGKQRRKVVRQYFNIPVKFSFEADVKSSEESNKDNNEDEIFKIVENQPSFPGGADAEFKYFKENVKYPELAKKNDIEGIIYVWFVVEKDGSITNVKIQREIGGGCDEEALRVIKNMPKWNPGTQKGAPVRVRLFKVIQFSDSSKTEDVFEGVEYDDIEEELPPTNSKEDEIFVFVEYNASFPGGVDARMKYLRENITYPKLAKESGIQGTVYLKFVVEKNGSITNVKVLRGIGGGCDEEAMRVVKNMPKWNPAKQRGKPVRVQFNMPIKFVLSGGKTKKLSKREQKKLDKQKRKEAKHRE